jgi:small subunit ribosomal protein S27Ae
MSAQPKAQEKPAPPTTKPVAPASPQSTQQPVSKPQKKERIETPMYKFYKVEKDKVSRLRRECPRCGKGTFLAEHKDRLTCGKCGYTSYKKPLQR